MLEGNAKLGGALPMNTHGGLIRQAAPGGDAPHGGGRSAAARRGRRRRAGRREPPGPQREARHHQRIGGDPGGGERLVLSSEPPGRPRARGDEMSTEQSTKPAYTKPLPDMRPEGETFWAGTPPSTSCLLPVNGGRHAVLVPAGPHPRHPRAGDPYIEAKGTGTVYTLLGPLHRPQQGLQGRPAARGGPDRPRRGRADDVQPREGRARLPVDRPR